MALQGLDDDEKLTSTLLMSGQNREVWLVNESGLYALILRSNKPEAKTFKRWVTRDVLPTIRKTGSYSVQEALPQNYLEALKELVVYVEKSNRLEGQLAIAAPKAEFYDAVGQSKNALSMREQQIIYRKNGRGVYSVQTPQGVQEMIILSEQGLYFFLKGIVSFRDH